MRRINSSPLGWFRRASRRPHIPLAERVVVGGVLLLLAGVVAWVAHRGGLYDPALFQAHLLPATGTRAGVIPDNAVTFLEADLEACGWMALGPTEFFSADEMYMKINGKADAYLAFDCQSLESRSWGAPGEGSRFVEVYLFDMHTPLNAMGILAQVRPGGAVEALPVGQEGYLAQGSCFFRQGRYYVEIAVADTRPDSMAAARTLAEELAARLPVEQVATNPLEALPEAHQIPDSKAFILENAFGLGFLHAVAMARYDWRGEQLTAFVVPSATAGDTREWFTQYVAGLDRDGEILEQEQAPTAGWAVGEVFGFCDAVFFDERWFGGVREAELRDPAVEFMREFQRALPDSGEGDRHE